MPGWHVKAEQWRDRDDFVMLGVTQEQHPERCQLFAQWHQIEWPILHDPVNLLGATAVPLTVAIDERGVVRSTRPNPETFLDEFLDVDFSAEGDATPAAERINAPPSVDRKLIPPAEGNRSAEEWMAYGDALLLWKQPTPFDKILPAYEKAAELDPLGGRVAFRRGVVLRMRFESDKRQVEDFQNAVDSWSEALATDPNQYIWRRRIQQYGPRLDKPYPFYDWIEQARAEIRQRGDVPTTLPVEPRGAELASPQRGELATDGNSEDIPPRLVDKAGQVTRDLEQFVDLKQVVVRGTGSANRAFQVHLKLVPNDTAHWNNETDPVAVWLELPQGVVADRTAQLLPMADEPESREERLAEFEIRVYEDSNERQVVRGYVLYNVCEEEGGVCLFRRQDFQFEVMGEAESKDD